MAAPSFEWLANELANIADRLETAQLPRQSGTEGSTRIPPASLGALSSLARLRRALQGFQPSQFIQHLAIEAQILSCLRWLCEFQVLACIPQGDSVAISDLGELLGIPEDHLDAVVSFMASAGFLDQPLPRHVAHTTLSASFLSDLSLADAAQFLGGCVGPAALRMAETSRRLAECLTALPSASASASSNTMSNGTPAADILSASGNRHLAAADQGAKLRRQWLAFLEHTSGARDLASPDILARFDWFNLGNARIVEVGAESCELADALSRRYPSLEFVVQFHDDGPARTPTELTAAFAQLARANPRITVQQRRIGASQPIRDAAVYILRVPSVLSTVPDQVASWNRGASISQAGPLALRHLVLAELGAHLDVLRTNSAAMLILTARLRTAAGGDGLGSANGEPENQALSQMGELVLLQLTGHREVELGDVLKWVESVGDEAGKLSVVHRLASPGTADVAFVVRYTRAGAGC